MLNLSHADKQPKMPLTVRAVFILDPSHIVRLILLYPSSCGRNFDEIIRVIDSLQLTTFQKVTTPGEKRFLCCVVCVHIETDDLTQPTGSPART